MVAGNAVLKEEEEKRVEVSSYVKKEVKQCEPLCLVRIGRAPRTSGQSRRDGQLGYFEERGNTQKKKELR